MADDTVDYLVLMLVSLPFSLVKSATSKPKHKHKHKKNEHVRSSFAYVEGFLTCFSGASASASAYVLVKTRRSELKLIFGHHNFKFKMVDVGEIFRWQLVLCSVVLILMLAFSQQQQQQPFICTLE